MNLLPWFTTLTEDTIFLLLQAEKIVFPVLISHKESLLPPAATKVNPEGKRSMLSSC